MRWDRPGGAGDGAAGRPGLSTSSTVAAALDARESRGLLFREGDAITFDSPFVRRWVEREALPDVPPH